LRSKYEKATIGILLSSSDPEDACS
jgi:hypothetical protein